MENVDGNRVIETTTSKKMSPGLFSALFCRHRDEPQDERGVVVVDVDVDVDDVVDLTTQAERQADREPEPPGRSPRGSVEDEASIPSIPSSSASTSAFCSHCLRSLTPLNFLAKMQHVKTCPGGTANARMVDGRHAVARFLSYYGYEELVDVFADKGIEMDLLEIMDVGGLERLTGVALGRRKKFVYALDRYRESGRLQVRNALVDIAGTRRTKDERKTTSWARSTRDDVVRKGEREGGGGAGAGGRANGEKDVDREGRPEPGTSAASIDKVLLESLWDRSGRRVGKRSAVNVESCELWVSAATCNSTHVTLEDRLKKARLGVQEEKERQHERQLERHAADLATKRASVKAMKEELEIQRQTVRQLESMIADMQAEIDAGEQQQQRRRDG